jgi:hypothetical protein
MSQAAANRFADYVGSLGYHGLEGVERSTARSRALRDDLAFDVVDQVAEGDRVAGRFVVTGPTAGSACGCGDHDQPAARRAHRRGLSAFDSLELLKQLGLRRTLLVAPRMLRALRDGRPVSS